MSINKYVIYIYDSIDRHTIDIRIQSLALNVSLKELEMNIFFYVLE